MEPTTSNLVCSSPLQNILNFRDVGQTINHIQGNRSLRQGRVFRSARPVCLYPSASIFLTPSRQVTGVSLDAKYYCPSWHLPDLVVGSKGIAESNERRTTPPSQTGKPSSLNTTSPTPLICAPQPSTLSRPKNQMPKSAPQRHFLRPTTRRPSR